MALVKRSKANSVVEGVGCSPYSSLDSWLALLRFPSCAAPTPRSLAQRCSLSAGIVVSKVLLALGPLISYGAHQNSPWFAQINSPSKTDKKRLLREDHMSYHSSQIPNPEQFRHLSPFRLRFTRVNSWDRNGEIK